MASKTRSERLPDLPDDDSNARFINNSLRLAALPQININDPDELQKRVLEYFQICAEDNIKPSVVGLAVSMGVDRRKIWDYVNEVRPINPQSRGVLKKAYELLDLNMNNLMLNGKINPVSGIFLMKNHYGYRDQQDVVVAKDNLLGDATDNKALEEKYMKSIPCDVVEITPIPDKQNDDK